MLIRNSTEVQNQQQQKLVPLDNQLEDQDEMDAKEVIKRLQTLVNVNSPSKVPEAVRDLLNNSQQNNHQRSISLNDQTKDSRQMARNVNPEHSMENGGVESIDFEYEVRQPEAGTNHKQNLVLPDPADVNNK